MVKKNHHKSREEIRQAQERIRQNGTADSRNAATEVKTKIKPGSGTETKSPEQNLKQLTDRFTDKKALSENTFSTLPDSSPKASELQNLEDTLAKEKIPLFIKESEYTKELSREPVQILYDQARALSQRAEEKGYLNQTEQRQLEYITGAIEEKVEGGEYSFTEEAARKASLILELASESRQLYKSTKSNQKSWYKSG
ncbi:MAG TPA: hypothetical protein VJH68_05965 [Candidatus Nanoarchaeia archaeon]|nr:hypothetical protein [Candidatus Nanoarchaeia archaeon]